MTGEQKKWLDDHPTYRVIGPRCGLFQFEEAGWLHPDGIFNRSQNGPRAFRVGVLKPTTAPPSDGLVRLR